MSREKQREAERNREKQRESERRSYKQRKVQRSTDKQSGTERERRRGRSVIWRSKVSQSDVIHVDIETRPHLRSSLRKTSCVP